MPTYAIIMGIIASILYILGVILLLIKTFDKGEVLAPGGKTAW